MTLLLMRSSIEEIHWAFRFSQFMDTKGVLGHQFQTSRSFGNRLDNPPQAET